jgi:hypothetical protein
MDLTEGSETSANINQTLGKHPKVNTVNKLSYIEYNVVSIEEDDKNSITDMWDPTVFIKKSIPESII